MAAGFAERREVDGVVNRVKIVILENTGIGERAVPQTRPYCENALIYSVTGASAVMSNEAVYK